MPPRGGRVAGCRVGMGGVQDKGARFTQRTSTERGTKERSIAGKARGGNRLGEGEGWGGSGVTGEPVNVFPQIC